MRLVAVSLLVAAASCGVDTRSARGLESSSDPGVDGGAQADGGGSTTNGDARVPPPGDGSDAGAPLTVCQEAVNHSDLRWIQDNVFTTSCASCHGASSPSAGLDLSDGHSYGALVNVKSIYYPDWNLVTPRDSPNSMLMVRLGGETGPTVAIMPKGQPALCQEKIDAIRRWITAGAAND
jgi:hypothetical protein